MRALDARDLAIIADALPWYAKWLQGLAWRTQGAEALAYRERATRAWQVEATVRALHVAAVADERLG